MRRCAAILAVVMLVSCGLFAQTAQQPAPPKASAPEPGELSAGVYRNPSFGFTYKLPYGWVDRTSEMREASKDPAKSMVLLGVFERPPEANGEGVNSGVVIAAESAASYPGLKSAAQYFGPLERNHEGQRAGSRQRTLRISGRWKADRARRFHQAIWRRSQPAPEHAGVAGKRLCSVIYVYRQQRRRSIATVGWIEFRQETGSAQVAISRQLPAFSTCECVVR